ncbi:hypothetical protein ACJJTC_012548, partial [Scirpophaga incertulas]
DERRPREQHQASKQWYFETLRPEPGPRRPGAVQGELQQGRTLQSRPLSAFPRCCENENGAKHTELDCKEASSTESFFLQLTARSGRGNRPMLSCLDKLHVFPLV